MKRFILVFLMMFCTVVLYSSVAMAISMDEFKLNGFLDLEYEASYKDDLSSGDKNGSFDQAHFNLLMEFPISDNLTTKGHIEYEHVPRFEIAGDGAEGSGEIIIEWAYLEYIINNSLRLRAGTGLTPFGIYNEIHDATPAYMSIRVPFGIYKSHKAGGEDMFPTFNTGLTLMGSHFTEGHFNLNYIIYAGNGENDSGTNEAENDENTNKAIGGKLIISPLPGLNAGGSFFTGKKGTARDDHSAWVASIDYYRSPIEVRAEYASSKLGDTTETGWYGEASYRIRMVTPFVRYGTLDPDNDVDDDEWTELVYGIDYEIEPNFLIKIENRHFNGNTNNTDVSDDYNELGAAVIVAF